MDAELKFDMDMPDFSLAEQYLTTFTEFKSSVTLEHSPLKTYCKNTFKTTTYHVYRLTNGEELKELTDKKFTVQRVGNINKGIRENEDLIIQLESLLRHIPEDETRFNLKILLSEVDPYLKCGVLNYTLFLYFDEHTPLACVAAVTESGDNETIILCTPAAAPLVQLLTKILRDCGYAVEMLLIETIKPMPWVFREDIKEITYKKNVSEFGSGCVGVVTESADIDSAVDVFLSSFAQKPWRIQRILVQENVYDSFKNTLHWKSQRQRTTTNLPNNVHREIQSKCAAVYQFKDKAFLIDYADANISQDMQLIVLVEAYRNNQELISLLKTYSPFGTSVWCNDVSVTNTISYKSEVSLVWINDYNYFKGCSDVFYNKLWISTLGDYPRVESCWGSISPTAKRGVIEKDPQFKNEILLNSFKILTIESEKKRNEISVDSSGQCVTIKTPQSQIEVTARGFSDCYYRDYHRFAKILNIISDNDTALYVDCKFSDSRIPAVEMPKILQNSPLYKCKSIFTRFL